MKRILVCTAVLAAMALMSGLASAEQYTPSMKGRFAIGGGPAWSDPEDIISQWGLWGTAEYYVYDWLSITGDYRYYEWEGNIEAFGLHGEVETSMISAGVHFNFPQWSSFSTNYNVYLGGGINYFMMDTTLDVGIPADIDDDFGFYACAGFNWFMTEDLALNVDLRCTMMQPDGTLGGNLTEVELDPFEVGIALKYHF